MENNTNNEDVSNNFNIDKNDDESKPLVCDVNSTAKYNVDNGNYNALNDARPNHINKYSNEEGKDGTRSIVEPGIFVSHGWATWMKDHQGQPESKSSSQSYLQRPKLTDDDLGVKRSWNL